MKKLVTVMTGLLLCSSVFAAELKMQGMYLGMSKQEAKKVMTDWFGKKKKVKKADYINAKKNKYQIGDSKEDTFVVDKKQRVSEFKMSGKTVDKIFGVKGMEHKAFAQAIIDNYDWIDSMEYKSEMANKMLFDIDIGWYEGMELVEWYEHSDYRDGWKLKIFGDKSIHVEQIDKVSPAKSFR